MDFEWDDHKSAQCVRDRGFSFADVLSAFDDPQRRIETDQRREYGEVRHRLYGSIGGRLFVIAYTTRGRTVRIISPRKANGRERRRHVDEGTIEARPDGR